MKRNIIRKNTGLNGISIERQIEVPDYDMTLLKLSTMTPYLEGRRVHKTLDHNKKKDEGIPLNMIIYEASEKLIETPKPYPKSGLDTTKFSDSSGQKLTMTSHTFENGVGTIEFDGDIASIGNYTFYGCSGLTSIKIPSSVTRIDSWAFENTPWWNTYSVDTASQYGNIIYINDIAYKAFSTSITRCEFREGTVSISELAFRECVNLTSVTIPDSVTSISNGAFEQCTSLTSITIPNSVTSIDNSAFAFCTSLTSIEIPNSVTSIGPSAFEHCTSLTNIVIPNSVTSIDQRVFSYCTSLISITVDGSNTIYDSRDNCNAIIRTSTNELIQGCKNTIIPNSVTSISDGAFYDCSSLTSIIIPNSVTSIGRGAFYNCSSLTSVTIPNSVTSIGNSAFAYCTSLTSVTIDNGVTSIGESAFAYCNNLASITSLATTAPTIQSNTFRNVKTITTGRLYVPSGSSGYDVWMGTGNYYLGKYGWTKVEQ